ncbi:cytochrome P450 [Streptantibioticus ferralitis]|uniref:Cytochrome P450 n=1 Tax=Streptantibioticus ferralitis TaxID=236510 RepID=A0ABT5YTR3_9ACTN|nr:cytochrome P450 [Streptantibioticus ferralitis]MDF2254993.1 cytochrome P450 [Streptantibioticus ferralitis]
MRATTSHHLPIPSMPGALPLLGHMPQLRRQPLEFVRSLRAHGDVVRFRLGPRAAYAVNSPVLIRQLLVTEAAADAPVPRRGPVRPVFHPSRIRQYAATMCELAEARVDSWRHGAEILLDQELFSLSLATVTKVLFSGHAGQRLAEDIRRTVPVLLEGLGRRALTPVSALDRLPTPMNLRFKRALRTLQEAVRHTIAEYRADPAGGLESGDLLSMLLTARDEATGAGLSDEQVYDEVLTMLIAGTETTAGALSWACHLLSRNHDAQRRFQRELDEALGRRDVRHVSHETLQELAFQQRVIAETLRLYPSTWTLTRRPTNDVEFAGHRIPAGATVLFSIYALQRDPELFAHPEQFDPDRWLPESTPGIPWDAYIPFGSGLRGCAGEQFARAEMAAFLSVIFSRCSVQPVPGRPAHLVTRLMPMPSAMPLIVRRRPRSDRRW